MDNETKLAKTKSQKQSLHLLLPKRVCVEMKIGSFHFLSTTFISLFVDSDNSTLDIFILFQLRVETKSKRGCVRPVSRQHASPLLLGDFAVKTSLNSHNHIFILCSWVRLLIAIDLRGSAVISVAFLKCFISDKDSVFPSQTAATALQTSVIASLILFTINCFHFTANQIILSTRNRC